MARERREAWATYTDLVEKGRAGGLDRFSEAEVRAFGRLYRGVTADLARARTYGASPGLLEAVERWAGAGHNLLYRAKGKAAVPLGRWIARELPRAVRRHHRLVLLAAPAALRSHAGFLRGRPGSTRARARSIMPAGMLARAENTARGDINASYIEVEGAERPTLSSALVTNNVRVSFVAFAAGLLAGVGTVMILVFNGVLLGAAFRACTRITRPWA